jgi:hypothetical protein
MKTKKYEVEIVGTTCRTYFITAESAEKAEEIAFSEMEADWEIPSAWKQNSDLSYIEEVEEDSMELNDSELDKLNQDL